MRFSRKLPGLPGKTVTVVQRDGRRAEAELRKKDDERRRKAGNAQMLAEQSPSDREKALRQGEGPARARGDGQRHFSDDIDISGASASRA
jgi:hypothetical protein